MRRSPFAPAVAALCGLASVLPAQDSRPSPIDADVRAAVAHATKIILDLQENYVETERSRTRFQTAAERKAWRQKQKAVQSERAKELGPVREWPYEGVYRLGPVIAPGYRVGGTAICCWALLEAPGFEADEPRRAAFQRGIAFILDAFEKDPLLQSGFDGTYDVRGWAHNYGLRALLRARERRVLQGEAAKRADERIRLLVKALQETEIPENGGWHYGRSGANEPCSPSTFMTAPTLQALFEARKQGFDVPDAVVMRGLDAIEKARLRSGAFQYATEDRKTGQGFEAVPGACARMAVCETTLYLGGRGSLGRIRSSVEAFFENWKWLEKRRQQQGTHVPPYMIAPYYFHYAHTYVAQAIEQLPEKERPQLRAQLRALYWLTRDEDGGWNDRQFPRSEGYGSAMAILGLMMPELPLPARWEPTVGTATRPGK